MRACGRNTRTQGVQVVRGDEVVERPLDLPRQVLADALGQVHPCLLAAASAAITRCCCCCCCPSALLGRRRRASHCRRLQQWGVGLDRSTDPVKWDERVRIEDKSVRVVGTDLDRRGVQWGVPFCSASRLHQASCSDDGMMMHGPDATEPSQRRGPGQAYDPAKCVRALPSDPHSIDPPAPTRPWEADSCVRSPPRAAWGLLRHALENGDACVRLGRSMKGACMPAIEGSSEV